MQVLHGGVVVESEGEAEEGSWNNHKVRRGGYGDCEEENGVTETRQGRHHFVPAQPCDQLHGERINHGLDEELDCHGQADHHLACTNL